MMAELIWQCQIPLNRHPAQKNEKVIQFRRGTSTPFIGSRHKFKQERDALLAVMVNLRLNDKTVLFPVKGDTHVKFTFYFNNYYTVKGQRNQKLPDLSNLYHFPEDVMQDAGIIENDSFICSHDGSRRLPSPGNINLLDISIFKFNDIKQQPTI